MATYPIILAHGIARFDILRERLVRRLRLDNDSLPDHFHYFRKIHSHLSAAGFTVHHSNVKFAGLVAQRAAELKTRVEEILSRHPEHEKVHIIGHSMGGLDSRHMIAELGMQDRVCSLTTVGTPHRGSSFADWGLAHRGDEILRRLEDVIHVEGLLNLTSEDTEAFNARVEAAEAENDVFYQTYSCWEEDRERVFTPLQPPWEIIRHAEREHFDGLNDGLVSVRSMRWTDRLRGAREKEVVQRDFPVRGDHLNEVGWWEVHQLSGRLHLGDLFRNARQAIEHLLGDRREYERQIKDTYLSMAEDLERRFPI